VSLRARKSGVQNSGDVKVQLRFTWPKLSEALLLLLCKLELPSVRSAPRAWPRACRDTNGARRPPAPLPHLRATLTRRGPHCNLLPSIVPAPCTSTSRSSRFTSAGGASGGA